MNLEINKASHNESLPIDLLLLADPSEELIERYRNSGESYLAKVDEELIGGFILVPTSLSEVEIKNIAIYESFQNKGIGKELMKYAIRTAKMEAYEKLIVKTANTSQYQINFYQNLKFKLETIIKGHFLKYYKRPILENGEEAIDQLVFIRKL